MSIIASSNNRRLVLKEPAPARPVLEPKMRLIRLQRDRRMRSSPTMHKSTTRLASTSSLRPYMGHNLLVISQRPTAARRSSKCILISNTRSMRMLIIRRPVTWMAILRILPDSRCKATDEELVSSRRTASLPMPTNMSIILAAQEQRGKSWTFSVGELSLELAMIGRFDWLYMLFRIASNLCSLRVEYPGGVPL